MTAPVPIAFLMEPFSVPLEKLIPTRAMPPRFESSPRFRQILSSIREIGLIEPLSVVRDQEAAKGFMLLDGHFRKAALRLLGLPDATCLEATSDEAYTYNSKVNRLSTIQEHVMIKRAIDRGVPSERLASVLGIHVNQIYKKASLLNGICPEAAALLQDRRFSVDLVRILRQMNSARQIECVELMVAANTTTVTYAQALLAATPDAMLLMRRKFPKPVHIGQPQMQRMEQEMSSLQGQYKDAEQTYGQDLLNLVVVKAYLASLLRNQQISAYLRNNYFDLLRGLEAIPESPEKALQQTQT
ncbi:plasmid partitioning protein RepB C-terminal domain-containing protein [Undibacterium sp.]|jgi:hypothetical protein|uniref:plasmid partitioning protein RepB C-terminal domain-containing protein n=1 Tax=Undibacterium sp. TaxID=1914977 RepID=UPI002CDF52CA|nr:plasmid partitioning protein RepB C-terminal domain-containing protein [Undibacterium sp.]HTD02726.1 plasmid partitioning protein RepB C-terminal domain-containing protein [Undibacterium sp.]